MNTYDSAPFEFLRRLGCAGLLLTLAAAPIVGCNSANEPDRSMSADLAAIRIAHSDANDIGSLDATAPPANLNDYRKPVYRTASAH